MFLFTTENTTNIAGLFTMLSLAFSGNTFTFTLLFHLSEINSNPLDNVVDSTLKLYPEVKKKSHGINIILKILL